MSVTGQAVGFSPLTAERTRQNAAVRRSEARGAVLAETDFRPRGTALGWRESNPASLR